MVVFHIDQHQIAFLNFYSKVHLSLQAARLVKLK